jgi:hypothetical protein
MDALLLKTRILVLTLTYTSLILRLLSQVTLTFTGSSHSMHQTSCPISIALVAPKDQSRSEAPMYVSYPCQLLQSCYTSPKPKNGKPPLVGGPRLLIQYIRSYPLYWKLFLHSQPEDVPRRGDSGSSWERDHVDNTDVDGKIILSGSSGSGM